MAKPVFIVKTDRSTLINSSKMEEFREFFSRVVASIGDEYHVIAMTKEYDVAVLNGELFEVTDEKWEQIKEILKGE